MSSSSPPSSSSVSLDDHEESVRIAVRALGDMRNGGAKPGLLFHYTPTHNFSPALFTASSSTSPSLPSPEDVDAPDFVYRVSHLPIVTSALRVYSQGKASSRVVKVHLFLCPSFTLLTSRIPVRCRNDGILYPDNGASSDRSTPTCQPTR